MIEAICNQEDLLKTFANILPVMQMAFLMSGASYLSPSAETAQHSGRLDLAAEMLQSCRESINSLKHVKGNLPADASKTELYLDLQVLILRSLISMPAGISSQSRGQYYHKCPSMESIL